MVPPKKQPNDMMCNGQNVDTAGPLAKLFKNSTKEQEAGVVAHQNSANRKALRTQEFSKDALQRMSFLEAAANQQKNKKKEDREDEEGEPQKKKRTREVEEVHVNAPTKPQP